jgi:nicotinate-nucleotide pyrophosphorylase (carboxylating)
MWYPWSMSVPRPYLVKLVQSALEEDLGRGDVTTAACVAAESVGRATLRARENSVFCGAEVVREVFAQLDPGVLVQALVADGTRVAPGTAVMSLSGSARSLLEGERVALNFVQRLSGVATLTRTYVDALPAGSRTRITDTRKTTPGLRTLERHAVRCGGGYNHREDLAAAVLIKDNHIAAAGGVATAIERARERAPHTSRIECEVDRLSQLEIALQHHADIVLLDNFSAVDLAQAVKMVAGRAIIEVSGGISLERVHSIALAGADIISVGALTHSARAIDLGLDWDEAP